MRFFLFLILTFLSCLGVAEESLEDRIIVSTPEEILTITSNKELLIGGLVSPLSGQLALQKQDLIATGAESLTLSRFYIPPLIPSSFSPNKKRQEEWNKFYLAQHLKTSYKGWIYLPHLRLEFFTDSKTARLTNPSGITLDFRLSHDFSKATLISPSYGLTNTRGSAPSGQFEIRNTEIICHTANQTFTIFDPDGTTRLYGNSYHTHTNRSLFLLLQETLPNGKVILYHYDPKKQLSSIEAKDPKKQVSYAKINIQNHLNLDGGFLTFQAHTGQQATHIHTRRFLETHLKENPFTGQKMKQFDWNPILPSLVTQVASPFFQNTSLTYNHLFLLTHLSDQDHRFSCTYQSFGNHFKVASLSLPVGPNSSMQPTYTFQYDPPIPGKKEGFTLVQNPDGTYLRYSFSQDLLLTSIEWLDPNKKLKKQKTYHWTKEHDLKAITIQDENQHLLYKKTYEYDSFGNPIKETLHGNLTGEDPNDTYTITRTYSQDGKNLLLQETQEDGTTTTYQHLKGTHLVTKKLIKDEDHILKREFHFYDPSHNLIKSIQDDGSGETHQDLRDVQTRTIKTYLLRQASPFLHMVDTRIETYLENKEEKLLKKTHFVYDSCGNIKEEHVYNANEDHAYTLHKTYDPKGNLLTETDPLGNLATYTYDHYGHLKTKTNFSTRLQTTYTYDQKQRLIASDTQGENLHHTKKYTYDTQDRLITQTNPFDHTTTYTYDPLSHQITQTTFPPISSLKKTPLPVQTHITYDPLGNPLTQTDANGHTTTYTYNAYGSPIKITYPDQTTETYTYTKKGELKAHKNQNGLTICYKRDLLGRILEKTDLSPSKERLARETFTYSRSNLSIFTDKEGHQTHYFYDGAGRKITEERSGHITHFSYDPLGFLETVTKENGENTLVTIYIKDPLGQILEERQESLSGERLKYTSFTYDADGNQTSLTSGQNATTTYTYDPLGRITHILDPLDNLTQIAYDEHHLNPLGQKVLKITKTDPLQKKHITIYDPFGNLAEKKTLNACGQTLSHEENFYDPNSNLLFHTDHIYQETTYLSSQTTHYTYTPQNQIACLTRGYRTLHPKTTTYTYTPTRQVATKTTPNQVTLTYTYDPLDHLQTLTSSEQTLFHTFEYNLLGHLLKATDELTNRSIQRKVDPFGNILKETFPSGLQITKTYDGLSRPLKIQLHKSGTIHNHYNPLHLKEVKRLSSQGKVLYTHSYNTYDLNGQVLEETPIFSFGKITHTYDLNQRPTKQKGPFLHTAASYDPLGNLKKQTQNKRTIHYTYDDLNQLLQEQSDQETLSYSYDSLYNKHTHQEEVTTLNSHHELLSQGETSYHYDENGNLTAQSNQTLIYDPLDRLTSLIQENTQTFFTYDPLGRRLSKTTQTLGFFGWYETTEYYLYDAENEIGAFDVSKTPISLKIPGLTHLPKSPEIVAIELNNASYLPVQDLQGNICMLIDSSQNIQAHYAYSAFGQELKSSFDKLQNPYRYQAKRCDLETGLIYFGKRYYHPTQSRFITTDPAGFISSYNLYQYAFNNPFRYIDPDGQFAFMVPLLVWGAEIALSDMLIGTLATGIITWGLYEGADALANWISKAEVPPQVENLPDLQIEGKEKRKY